MNSPQSLQPPQPVAPQTATQNSLPTAGALLGSVLGSILADALKLEPVAAASVIASLTTLVTALFHFVGSKLGVPL
jgi:hypothetical protein